jgi:hypothetical protein
MVVLDWTRMGRHFCLAGVVPDGDGLRVVRPLPLYARNTPVRNVGWPADFLRGRGRWEVFELVGSAEADARPPHREDLWVQNLRPRGRSAPADFRRAILQATQAPPNEPLFGVPLTQTRTSAFLAPGTGCRSLVSVTVAVSDLVFHACQRDGVAEPDYRVTLPLRGRAGRTLSMKDHFLLKHAESSATDLAGREQALRRAVEGMGPEVVVRLGLSRAFHAAPGRTESACWLMADGFFSPTDPQP